MQRASLEYHFSEMAVLHLALMRIMSSEMSLLIDLQLKLP